jgi:hypothetical protein
VATGAPNQTRLFERPELRIEVCPYLKRNHERPCHLRVEIDICCHKCRCIALSTIKDASRNRAGRNRAARGTVVQRSGILEDSMEVWTINFYGQRAFWYDIFVGLTDTYEILFCQIILETFPPPSFCDEYFEIRAYLRRSTGILPPPHAYTILLPSMKKKSNSCLLLQKLKDWIKKLNPLDRGVTLWTEHFIAKLGTPDGGLTSISRQSKLSQEQLTELQRSTHFDKKELQQWYKGKLVLAITPRVSC